MRLVPRGGRQDHLRRGGGRDEEEAARIAEEKRLAYNARMREYVKRRCREDPEFHEARKEYSRNNYRKHRDERLAYQKERRKDPEVRARHNAQMLSYYHAHKDDPEFMERRRVSSRKWYQKKKEAMQNDG